MVEKVTGYRVKGGQMIQDEESAIIAETMAEIISTIPELRLIADTVQANLKPLCLHMQQLAAFYAKNHPEVLGETTLETTLPGALTKEFWEANASHLLKGKRWEPQKGEWVDITFRPFAGCEAVQFSDQVVCEPCKLEWDVNDGDPPACLKLRKPVPVGEITSFRPSGKPKFDACVTFSKDELERYTGPKSVVVPFDEKDAQAEEENYPMEPEDVGCDCSALMNGDNYHSTNCALQIARRAPVAGSSEGLA